MHAYSDPSRHDRLWDDVNWFIDWSSSDNMANTVGWWDFGVQGGRGGSLQVEEPAALFRSLIHFNEFGYRFHSTQFSIIIGKCEKKVFCFLTIASHSFLNITCNALTHIVKFPTKWTYSQASSGHVASKFKWVNWAIKKRSLKPEMHNSGPNDRTHWLICVIERMNPEMNEFNARKRSAMIDSAISLRKGENHSATALHIYSIESDRKWKGSVWIQKSSSEWEDVNGGRCG